MKKKSESERRFISRNKFPKDFDYHKTIEELGKFKKGCWICGNMKDRLGIDHNHITKKVRGLLCMKCNTAIGLLGDDLNILLKAINYLQNYGK